MLVNKKTEIPLLCRLIEAPAPLSGQILAEEMDVSRVAVWKRIHGLQARGCPVESGPRGYRYNHQDINADLWRLEAQDQAGEDCREEPPDTAASQGNGECRLTLPSTMEAVKEAGRRGDPAGTCLVAAEQTAGRSRDSRRWDSPPGGFYASFLLRPPWPLAEAYRLNSLTARAVCRCLHSFAGSSQRFFPGGNAGDARDTRYGGEGDILLPDGQKIGGVLVEAEGQIEQITWAVAGIGLHPHPELPSRGRRDRLTRMLREELLKETS